MGDLRECNTWLFVLLFIVLGGCGREDRKVLYTLRAMHIGVLVLLLYSHTLVLQCLLLPWLIHLIVDCLLRIIIHSE